MLDQSDMMVNEHVIMIDVDSMMDTRLGTIDKLYGSAVSGSILNKQYITRPTDELNLHNPKIDLDVYRKAFDKRDVESVGRGMPTNLMSDFGAMLDVHLEEILGPNPENKRIKIELNTAPYDFTAEEKQDLIDCFREWTGTPFDIVAVTIPVEQITMPLIASRKWSVIFTYDFDKFQYYTFVKNAKPGHVGNPQVSLFVPRLAASIESLKESANLTLPNGDHLDTFDFLRVHYGPLIGIEFIDVEKFCAYFPDQ